MPKKTKSKYDLTKSKIRSRFKLTLGKIEKAAHAMRAGLPQTMIYEALGCSPPTYYKWMGIGQELAESEQEPKNKDETLCIQLYLAINDASFEGTIADMQIIEQASMMDWRAAQYRLKVRNKVYNVDKQKVESQDKEDEYDDDPEFEAIAK